MDDVWTQLAVRIERERAGRRGYCVGIAGAVAAGKSTAAGQLAEALRAAGAAVEVVTTDGFLHPNRELARRGLLERKGFPESYDTDRLAAVLAAARAGAATLTIPVYSHERYDVLDDVRLVPLPDVLVVEGVNALQPGLDHDLAVFVDAHEGDLVAWYVRRFLELTVAARHDATSFYARFGAFDDAEVAALARQVWDAVNGPNLRDHILPTRARADVVIAKAADHRVRSVTGLAAHPSG